MAAVAIESGKFLGTYRKSVLAVVSQAPRIARLRPDAPALGSMAGLWHSLRTEKLSVYALLAYLMFEYVRPQSIYSGLDVLPWSAGCLLLSVLLAFGEQPIRHLRGGLTALLSLFTVVVLLSCTFAYSRTLAFDNFNIYFNWLLLYFAFVSIVNTRTRWVLAMAAFLLFSFKMSQHGLRTWAGRGFAFAGWGLGGPPGWFHNSGELGIQMCIFLPLSIACVLAFQRQWSRWVRALAWLMPISALATIIGSSSRGAVLGGMASLLPLLVRSRYRVKATLIVSVVVVVGYLLTPPEFKDRFRSAGEDNTSTQRLERWEAGIDMMLDHPLFGIGYFNWQIYYAPTYLGEQGAMLSHNIFVQAGSELGILGLALFVVMILACFRATARIRAAVQETQDATTFSQLATGMDGAMIGFIVSGFFVTVLYYPFFWMQLAFTAALYGIVCRHGKPVASVGGASRREVGA